MSGVQGSYDFDGYPANQWGERPGILSEMQNHDIREYQTWPVLQ